MFGSSSDAFSPDPPPRVAVVVVAGGSGRRMGAAAGEVRKQYLHVAGEPVLLWAVRPFLEHPRVGDVTVVLPPEDLQSPPGWLVELPVRLVAGGAERGDSVWNGLQAVPATAELVLVHDGARPFVTRAVIDRVIDRAEAGGAVAAVRATDTLKEVDADGRVTATADRARLWHAQTPQGFPAELLREAYDRARAEGFQGTDDASLLERYGMPVYVVEGAHENIKITRPADLPLAELLARGLRAPAP